MDQQPLPQSNPQPQLAIPPPPPPKKNSGVLIGIFLLFLGILVGLALDKTTLLSDLRIPYLSATPTPIPLASPKPTAEAGDPTANWKTYINTQYQYSVKYPDDYSVSETSADYVRFSPRIIDPNAPQSQTYMSIQLDKNPQQIPDAVYKTTSDGKKLRISQLLMDTDESQKPQIKAIFDQILSTFKFTDTNAQKVDTCLEQIYHLGSNAPGMTGMANPASVFCGCMGGQLETRENDKGQYGICIMDGKEYDEWEYVKKFLPPDNPFIPLSSPTPTGGAL